MPVEKGQRSLKNSSERGEFDFGSVAMAGKDDPWRVRAKVRRDQSRVVRTDGASLV